MDEGTIGFVIGLIIMVVIAPKSLRTYREVKKQKQEQRRAENDGGQP